jgi:hypothetical protein
VDDGGAVRVDDGGAVRVDDGGAVRVDNLGFPATVPGTFDAPVVVVGADLPGGRPSSALALAAGTATGVAGLALGRFK